MVNVTVLRSFRDYVEHVNREPGDVFRATEERAASIADKLPGFIAYEAADGPVEAKGEQENTIAEKKPEKAVSEAQADVSKLTVAQLKGLCAERRIDVPKGAKKADLVALLEE